MYFADLTPYAYPDPARAARDPQVAAGFDVVHVGWLEDKRPQHKGRVPLPLVETLLRCCCTEAVNRYRGWHTSRFAPEHQSGFPVMFGNREHLLGNAEIRVAGLGNRIYAAPNLIYHYIRDIGYVPPQEFLDAVARLPR